MTTVILCATQRCGSTMIVEDMRNTSVLGNPEEWFVSWSPKKTEIDWTDALSSLRQRATGENGVTAIKVMADQLNHVEDCLKTVLRPPPGPHFFRFHKVFEDAKWVKLTRRDIVAQSVSRVMSRQTGINHATAHETDDHFSGNLVRGLKADHNAAATYSYEAILTEVTAIALENLAWFHFFQNFGIEPLELFYEEVAQDDEMTHLDKIGALVGEPSPSRRPRKMIKLGNEKNQNWIQRFQREAAASDFRAPD